MRRDATIKGTYRYSEGVTLVDLEEIYPLRPQLSAAGLALGQPRPPARQQGCLTLLPAQSPRKTSRKRWDTPRHGKAETA